MCFLGQKKDQKNLKRSQKMIFFKFFSYIRNLHQKLHKTTKSLTGLALQSCLKIKIKRINQNQFFKLNIKHRNRCSLQIDFFFKLDSQLGCFLVKKVPWFSMDITIKSHVWLGICKGTYLGIFHILLKYSINHWSGVKKYHAKQLILNIQKD